MSAGRKRIAIALVIGAIALVGWLDMRTGPHLSFALFYLVPIMLTGWMVGRAQAVFAAFVAAGTWLAAELHWHTDAPFEIGWNAGTRLVIFAVLGWLSGYLQANRQSLVRANDQLRELLDREAIRARTDALTGLANWQGFQEQLDRELARSRRTHEPLALAYVDLDNFKRVNDRYGHSEGDRALRRVGEALQRSVRDMDVPARTGGDEFAVLLPGAGADSARGVVERIIAAVQAVAGDYADCDLGASVGVVCHEHPPPEGSDLVRDADAAMYQAKRQGKGQAVLVQPG